MNFGSGNHTSHIFYIIFIILCSLLILNIVERIALEHIEDNKKKINPIYYEHILSNIKLSKVVLYIALFAIFIIIINPLKLFQILNVNILSILSDQYTHITSYNELPMCDSPLYITNKTYLNNDIDKKFDLSILDKTISEWIMNKPDDLIYERIRINFEDGLIGDNQMCNLIKSIDLDNKLSNINYEKFNDLIESKYDDHDENLVRLWNSFTKNNKKIELDESQYKKFETFNNLINGTMSTIFEKNYENHIYFVLILAIYYFSETIYELYTLRKVEMKKISENLEIVASGSNYTVFVIEIIINIVIFIILLRLLNEKTWLVNTNLVDIYKNKYIPLLLFSTNTIAKIMFKFNKYITYDSFLFIKLTSLLSTTTITGLCGLYFWNSYQDKMSEITDKNDNEDIIQNIMFNYVGNYQTGVVLIGLLISVFSHLHSISYNYYDVKKAQIADKSGKMEGMIISRNWHYYIDLLLIFAFNFSSFSLSNCKEENIITMGNSDIMPKDMSINTLIKIFIVSTSFIISGLSHNADKSVWVGPVSFISSLIGLWMLTSYVPTQKNMTVTEFAGLTGDKLTNVGGFDIKRLAIYVTPIIMSMIITHIPEIDLGWLSFMFVDAPGQNDGLDKTIRAGLIGSIIGLSILSYNNSKDIEYQTVLVVAFVNVGWYIISKYIDSDLLRRIAMMVLLSIMIILIINLTKNKNKCGGGGERDIEENNEENGENGGNISPGGLNQGGGALLKNIEMDVNVSEILKYFIIGFVCILLYKLYINYRDNKRKQKNKIIKGGNSEDIINYDKTYDIKPTDIVDKEIIQLVIALVLLVILYTTKFLNTKSLSSFIQDELFNPSNLNILRLMFFPIVIIILITVIVGGKVFKSLLLRQMEKQSIGNFDSDISVNKREQKLMNKYNKKTEGLLSPNTVRIIKYIFIGIILLWYLGLLYKGRIALSPILLINISIIVIYLYLGMNVVYIFYKIYMNENVNNISEEIDKLQNVKKSVKFRQGKINPEIIDEVVEVDTEAFKEKYEEFILDIYKKLYDLLSINNIYLTNHIGNYIKTKLIKHKKLEEEFTLVNSNVDKSITQNPIKLDVNGKWTNQKDKNNIILYIYNNKVGVVIYLNETSYNNMKLVDVVFKDNDYEFFSDNQLLFTYSNGKINIKNTMYTRLSNEFSTDNIIKKTLADNDVFKNLNYMVSIDKDSRYIGKYNLVEDLTKYNIYKKNGDPLSLELEEIILNKVLLIKAIRDKKYKQAEEFSGKLNILESKFRKKMEFNKFDSNRDGTIDINEIDNYVNKNYKLSNPGFVKIKSVVFDGTHLIIQFDKKITNNDNSFKQCNSLTSCTTQTDINLESLFTLRINGTDYTSDFIDTQENTFIGSTSYISGAGYYFNVPDNYLNRTAHVIKLLTIPNPSTTGQSPPSPTNPLTENQDLSLTVPANPNNGDFELASTPPNYSGITFKEKGVDTKKVGTNNPNIEIINKNTLKIKLRETTSNNFIQQLNTSNDIKLYIPNSIKIYSGADRDTPEIRRTLKKSLVKIHKTINNFDEFDASIFGT